MRALRASLTEIYERISSLWRTSMRRTIPDRRRPLLPTPKYGDLRPPSTLVFAASPYDEVEVGRDDGGNVCLRVCTFEHVSTISLSREQAQYLLTGLTDAMKPAPPSAPQ